MGVPQGFEHLVPEHVNQSVPEINDDLLEAAPAQVRANLV